MSLIYSVFTLITLALTDHAGAKPQGSRGSLNPAALRPYCIIRAGALAAAAVRTSSAAASSLTRAHAEMHKYKQNNWNSRTLFFVQNGFSEVSHYRCGPRGVTVFSTDRFSPFVQPLAVRWGSYAVAEPIQQPPFNHLTPLSARGYLTERDHAAKCRL